MSAELKTALVNEALEISNQYKQNCALRYGLPEKPTKQQVGKLSEPAPTTILLQQTPAAPAATDSPSPGATAADAVKSSLLRRAAPWLLTALATGGVGTGLGALLAKQAPLTQVIQPPTDKDGSLLQFLEDKGFHLPEGSWPTK